MREFFGEWSAGPFHCYPFNLKKAGDCTILHAHKHDHLTRSNKLTALYALLPNKEERIEILQSAAEWRLVKANIAHLIVALDDDVMCECLFSHYDERGRFVQSPKELTRKQYVEATLDVQLPKAVEELLEREGIVRG